MYAQSLSAILGGMFGDKSASRNFEKYLGSLLPEGFRKQVRKAGKKDLQDKSNPGDVLMQALGIPTQRSPGRPPRPPKVPPNMTPKKPPIPDPSDNT